MKWLDPGATDKLPPTSFFAQFYQINSGFTMLPWDKIQRGRQKRSTTHVTHVLLFSMITPLLLCSWYYAIYGIIFVGSPIHNIVLTWSRYSLPRTFMTTLIVNNNKHTLTHKTAGAYNTKQTQPYSSSNGFILKKEASCVTHISDIWQNQHHYYHHSLLDQRDLCSPLWYHY